MFPWIWLSYLLLIFSALAAQCLSKERQSLIFKKGNHTLKPLRNSASPIRIPCVCSNETE